MKRQLNLVLGLAASALLIAGIGQTTFERLALAQTRAASPAPAAQAPARAPNFQVDPFWPKPLPNHWILGSVTGVAIDSRDHVWIVHNGANALTQNTEMGTGLIDQDGKKREPSAERCCSPAPPVLEFDAAGTLVSSWGGSEGGVFPRCIQGIAADTKGNVWIGGNAAETKGAAPRACQFGGGGSSAAPISAAVTAVTQAGAGGGGGGRGGAGGGAAGGGAAGGGRGGAGGGAAGAAGGGAAGGGRGGAGAAGAAGAAGGAAARGGRGGGAATPGPIDAMVIRFSGVGKLVSQIGAPGKVEGVASTTTLNRPTNMEYDAGANELYVADTGNRRVIVFDADSGAFKRQWGAYGNKPEMTDLGPYDPGLAPASQFRYVSCVRIAKDGMVYVCDKVGDRIQVFQKDGKFVKEAWVSSSTMGGENGGSVWDIAFSKDAGQRYVYVANGYDKKVMILQRDTLSVINTLGSGGRQAGQFVGVGSLAVDSKGNLYTGETFEGKRVQKWVLR